MASWPMNPMTSSRSSVVLDQRQGLLEDLRRTTARPPGSSRCSTLITCVAIGSPGIQCSGVVAPVEVHDPAWSDQVVGSAGLSGSGAAAAELACVMAVPASPRRVLSGRLQAGEGAQRGRGAKRDSGLGGPGLRRDRDHRLVADDRAQDRRRRPSPAGSCAARTAARTSSGGASPPGVDPGEARGRGDVGVDEAGADRARRRCPGPASSARRHSLSISTAALEVL